MYEFNTGDGHRGGPKLLQSKHWTQAEFDRSVSLLNEVIQVFRGSNCGPLAALVLFEEFPRPMRSLVAIKRDLARQPALALERPPEKRSSMLSIRGRILKRRLRGVYAPLQPFAPELFTAQGMRNPLPRMQMLDGFNQGRIEFEGGESGPVKGQVEFERVLKGPERQQA